MSGAISIAQQWAREIGFSIEIEHPDIYVARDVNNYAMHSPNEGWRCKKGVFSRGKGTKPQVIYDAVLEAAEIGTPVADYIRGHDDLFDFLYSGTVDKGCKIFYSDMELQRTNRWYCAKDGPALMRHSVKSKGRVANSDRSRVVNRLENADMPVDLDREHYVKEATKEWQGLIEGVADKSVLQELRNL